VARSMEETIVTVSSKRTGFFLWAEEAFTDVKQLEFAAFRRKPRTVKALQMQSSFEVVQPDGVLTAEAGDWLVMDTEGNYWPMEDEAFRAQYELAPATVPGEGKL